MEVFELVFCAEWNINRLSTRHKLYDITHRDGGTSIHHRPMLAAVLVALQGKPATTGHHNVFDFRIWGFHPKHGMSPKAVFHYTSCISPANLI